MFEAIWALLLKDHGAETWPIGVTLSLFTVPMIFLAPIGGRVAQRRGPLHVVTVSLAVATVCTFAYGVLPSRLLEIPDTGAEPPQAEGAATSPAEPTPPRPIVPLLRPLAPGEEVRR